MPRDTIYSQRGPTGEVQINFTPMIDCTLQLIIFFILTSQIVSKSLPTLKLHRPIESQAIPTDKLRTPNRVIVNVLPSVDGDRQANPALTGSAKRYEIGGNRIDVGDTGRLGEILRARKESAGTEEFYVEIRADRRINFSDVAPIMHAAAAAGVVNMNVTAMTGVGE